MGARGKVGGQNQGMSTMKIDFSKIVGRIKPLHGVNNGPKTLTFSRDMSKYFVEAGIPYSRLHDTEYPYGGGHFVDIPCVFPNFDADPEDPASYDFTLTDEYIKAIHVVGTKVFYRLGVSIEHMVKKYHIFPPKDYDKWARICAGIIRHYNEGWADGFHYGIEYWEIWNEPENPPMWRGTKEEYFRLYVTAANHLKKEFPTIKIGGYASCGFYGLTRPNQTDLTRSYVAYFTDFLAHISAPATRAPLDYFSWHIYTDKVGEVVTWAHHVEKTLREYGFAQTESILNEWNYMNETWSLPHNWDMKSASFVAATLCELQKTSVVLATYYDAQPINVQLCGIFDWFGPRKPFYALKAFNHLYRLGTAVPVAIDNDRVHACAATDSANGAILLSNPGAEPVTVALEIAGFGRGDVTRLEYCLLDETADLELKHSENCRGNTLRPTVTLAGHSVVLVKLSITCK